MKCWWRSTFRIGRLRAGRLAGHGFRCRRGAIDSLSKDDADCFYDFACLQRGIGPGLAHGGEEWVWNLNDARFKGLVHARERRDDGSVLSDSRSAECSDL